MTDREIGVFYDPHGPTVARQGGLDRCIGEARRLGLLFRGADLGFLLSQLDSHALLIAGCRGRERSDQQAIVVRQRFARRLPAFAEQGTSEECDARGRRLALAIETAAGGERFSIDAKVGLGKSGMEAHRQRPARIDEGPAFAASPPGAGCPVLVDGDRVVRARSGVLPASEQHVGLVGRPRLELNFHAVERARAVAEALLETRFASDPCRRMISGRGSSRHGVCLAEARTAEQQTGYSKGEHGAHSALYARAPNNLCFGRLHSHGSGFELAQIAAHHQERKRGPRLVVVPAADQELEGGNLIHGAGDERSVVGAAHRADARGTDEHRRARWLLRGFRARCAVERVTVVDAVGALRREETADLVEVSLRSRLGVPAVVLADAEGDARGVVLVVRGVTRIGGLRRACAVAPSRNEPIAGVAVGVVQTLAR